ELASRIAASPAAPGSAMDWAAVASGWEREAAARGRGTEAAALLTEAARIHERHLDDPAAALALLARAAEADGAWLPALRAGRRLAAALGDQALLAHLLELEERHTLEPGGRAELALAACRALASIGQGEASKAALQRAALADQGGFAVAEEQAV